MLKLKEIASLREGFARSFDGTEIYYRSLGRGTTILCCNGVGVSTFFWPYFEQHFRVSHQVVTWDYRGHGKSSLKSNDRNYSIDALVKDLTSVIKALKIKKVILVGHSLGVQVILEYYRRHRGEVIALIPCFGTYGHPMDTFFNLRFSPLIFRLVYFLGTRFPKQGNFISRLFLSNPLSYWAGGILKVMNTGMIDREDSERYVQHVLSVDPRLFTGLLQSAQESSCLEMLRTIRVPTLIIGGEQDQFTPAWISKKMHRLIPASDLFMMHKATHAGLVEQPDLFNLRVEKFLRERVGLAKRKSLKEARQRRITKVLQQISFRRGFDPLKLRRHER